VLVRVECKQRAIHNFRDWYCPLVKKLTLAILVTINLKVVPLGTYAPFPALLPLLKCILEVMICEGVQQRLQFCFDHVSCVKRPLFQFYLQSEKQRKVGWVEDDSHVVLGKKFPGEKGSVRRCVVMMQQPVIFSPKFGEKSSHVFRLFGLPGRILCEQSL
jgi:hypothetical protein